MEFDLSQFEAADTAILTVQTIKKDGPLLFNGEPVTIELYGPGSAQYAEAQAKIEVANAARTMAAAMGRLNKASAEDSRRDQAQKLAACTKSLNNFPIPGGPLALYSNPKLGYITEQVREFHADWANFPAASSKT